MQVISKAAGAFQTLQKTLAPSEPPAWSLCPRPRSSQVKVLCDISTASFTIRHCNQIFVVGEMLASTRLLSVKQSMFRRLCSIPSLIFGLPIITHCSNFW